MKKFFKSFAIMLIAVCAVIGCAFAVTACNTNSDYVFIIQDENGNAINGENVATQICTDQCVMLDAKQIYPDKNGKLTLSQAKVNELFDSDEDVTEFAFHVLYVEGYNEDCSFEVNGAKEYICKLYK